MVNVLTVASLAGLGIHGSARVGLIVYYLRIIGKCNILYLNGFLCLFPVEHDTRLICCVFQGNTIHFRHLSLIFPLELVFESWQAVHAPATPWNFE